MQARVAGFPIKPETEATPTGWGRRERVAGVTLSRLSLEGRRGRRLGWGVEGGIPGVDRAPPPSDGLLPQAIGHTRRWTHRVWALSAGVGGGLDTPKAGLASEAARSGEPCLPCSRLADPVGKILRFLDRSASQGSVHSRRTLDAHRIMGSV